MAQSLYRQASLIMNPYGAKDDLLPSIKPTDGSGDFTFSRDGAGASPATRVNASGLIEKGRENLLDYSNDFSNWTLASVTPTSGQSGYDGSSDAWELNKTNTGGAIINPTTLNGVATCSVYAKAGTLDFVLFYINYNSGTDTQAYFDLSTGSVGTTIAAIDSNITSLGSGWYRCDVSFNCPSTLADVRIFPAIADNDSTGTGTIYIQDAQLESGLVATDYIETTTAPVSAGLLGDMPRLDYSGGATCPSLLLEPSRTNAVTQSEYFDGGNLINTTITASYNTADTLSPEGVYNAAKLTATGSFPRYYDFPSTSDNTNIVISSFAKAGDASVFSLFASDKNLDAAQVYFDLSAGTATLAGTSVLTPVGYDIEPMGNGWYRCWLSINTGTGASSVQIRPIAHAQGQSGGWSGSNYIYAYGAQYETGSYPTSYIPTYGTAAPRAADSALGSFNGDGIFSSNWTAFCELVVPYEATTSGTAAGFTLRAIEGSTTNSNWSALLAHSSSTELTFNLYNGVSIDTNVFTYNWGTTLKVAVRYDGAYFINGTKYTSSITPQEPVEVSFGRAGQANASAGETAEIKQTLAFPTALTDAECIALTTI